MSLNRKSARVLGVLSVSAVCALALLAASAPRPSLAAAPPGCASVGAHAGTTSHDWEAVFGRRKKTVRAVALLRHVRRKGFGFRCAVIEREQRTHEVAVVGLHAQEAALRIAARAHRSGLAASAAQS